MEESRRRRCRKCTSEFPEMRVEILLRVNGVLVAEINIDLPFFSEAFVILRS